MMWLLALTSAFAADLQIDAEIGTMPTRGESMERFGRSGSMPVFGGRVGLALTDALTVQLASHHGRKGAEWRIDGERIGAAALYATDVTAGLEAVVPANEYFAAGLVGSGGVIIGRSRLDDAPKVDDSNVELAANAIAPMFRAAAVARFTVPDTALPIALQVRTSLGYQWSTPLDFGELGDAPVRGLSFRLGAGVQF